MITVLIAVKSECMRLILRKILNATDYKVIAEAATRNQCIDNYKE
ncbi:MAG: hypothetical protein ACFFDT_15180 [Candidatus Hodarchaeota archaeon]